MAELLVKARVEPGLDPSRSSVWARGEVVSVRPDGWAWGQEERPPKFVVLQVPGPVDDWQDLLDGYYEDPNGLGLEVEGRSLARRRFVIDLDALPDPAPDRAVSFAASRVRDHLTDRSG